VLFSENDDVWRRTIGVRLVTALGLLGIVIYLIATLTR